MYRVLIRVTPAMLVSELHYLDQETEPWGNFDYFVEGMSKEDACENALNEYHGSIAIKVLDDFDITVLEVKKVRGSL